MKHALQTRSFSFLLMGALLSLVVGCEGQLEVVEMPTAAGMEEMERVDPGETEEPPPVRLPELEPSPELVPEALPDDLPSRTSQQDCITLEPGESLGSVSPEGFAWLVRHEQGLTRLRVLDTLAMEREIAQTLELPDVESMIASTESSASLVAGDSLWRLDSFTRVRLETPWGLQPDASFCGTFADRGLLLSEGRLYELRDDTWWIWNPNLIAEQAPQRILDRQGECMGPDEIVWATSPDGTLWKIAPQSATRPMRFENLTATAATSDAVFALAGTVLWHGPEPWRAWNVEDLSPTHLSAASDRLWLAAEGQLLRWSEASGWEAISPAPESAIVALHAHDHGVWWSDGSQVCHQKTAPALRVEGTQPFQRTRSETFALRLSAEAPLTDLSVTLDDAPLQLQQAEDGASTVEGEWPGVGWHTLVISARDGDSSVSRTLHIERVSELERSWAQDIQPLFTEHCSECHGGPESLSTDLSTYERWVEDAERVRLYVVETQSMPPEGSRQESWSPATRTTIEQWLEGGMKP